MSGITKEAALLAVSAERDRQDRKWGVQDHPDLDPVLVGRPGGATPQRHAECLEIPTAGRAKFLCGTAADRGEVTWAAILTEELCEAVEAAALGDREALRSELMQVAAVAVAWMEALDRRVEAACQ